MNRSLIVLIILLLTIGQTLAGDQCDLSGAVGFQLANGQVYGVKDYIPDYQLHVTSPGCKNSLAGDDCTGAFNPAFDVSDSHRRALGKRFNADPSSLVFMKKLGARQPASMITGGLVGKCLP